MDMKTNKQGEYRVIHSRYNLFWYELVEVYNNKIVDSIGQFRSEEEARNFITILIN